MGVTSRRLGFALLVLAAVLVPFRKPRSEAALSIATDRENRARGLFDELQVTRLKWMALAERDSALARLPLAGNGGAVPSIQLQGFPAGTRVPSSEAKLASLWKAIGRTDSMVATLLLVYNAESYATKTLWGAYWGNLIVERRGITWCVTIIPGSPYPDGRLVVNGNLLDQSIAPCAMLAAFGRPGAGMSAWLDATRYNANRSVGWLTIPGARMEEWSNPPWRWLRDRRGDDAGWYQGSSLTRYLGLAEVATLLIPPYSLGGPGIRCIYGEAASCTEGVLRSGITTADDPGVPHDLTVGVSLLQPRELTLGTARPPAEDFLSEVLRAQGREQFRNFWKSELSFEQAFAQAFHEPLGNWAARWAKREWERTWEARFRSSTIILGADLHPLSLPLVLLWTLLALGAAAALARRKQVM